MKNHKKTWKCGNLQFPKNQKCGRETPVKHPWTTVKLRESTLFTVNARLKKHHFSIVFTIFMNFGFRWSKKKKRFMRELPEHIYVLVARSSWLGTRQPSSQHDWQNPWKSRRSLKEGKRNAAAAEWKDWTMISNRPRSHRELKWHLDCVVNNMPGPHKLARERHSRQDF